MISWQFHCYVLVLRFELHQKQVYLEETVKFLSIFVFPIISIRQYPSIYLILLSCSLSILAFFNRVERHLALKYLKYLSFVHCLSIFILVVLFLCLNYQLIIQLLTSPFSIIQVAIVSFQLKYFCLLPTLILIIEQVNVY